MCLCAAGCDLLCVGLTRARFECAMRVIHAVRYLRAPFGGVTVWRLKIGDWRRVFCPIFEPRPARPPSVWVQHGGDAVAGPCDEVGFEDWTVSGWFNTSR